MQYFLLIIEYFYTVVIPCLKAIMLPFIALVSNKQTCRVFGNTTFWYNYDCLEDTWINDSEVDYAVEVVSEVSMAVILLTFTFFNVTSDSVDCRRHEFKLTVAVTTFNCHLSKE